MPAPESSHPPVLDAHFHWLPGEIEDALNLIRGTTRKHGPEWTDLDGQLAFMDTLDRPIDVVSSAGVATGHFTDMALSDSRKVARLYNEMMADAQRRHPGRFHGACVLPLQDADAALEELQHAIGNLHLVGVSLPGRVTAEQNIDDPRLEPVYDEIEAMGAPLFLHPNDESFGSVLTGYGHALHMSLGRVIDLSVAAYRLVLSGIMERHPDLKIVVSHTGGALPYQAGRLDKNSGAAGLPEPPSHYLRRMYFDIVSPHLLGVQFAVDFAGPEHVIYGSDYPCWDPVAALTILDRLDVDDTALQRISGGNARALLGISEPAALGA